MNRIVSSLCIVMGGAFLSVSAHAACGGGGYKTSAATTTQQVAQVDTRRQDEKKSKLDGLQRDIDKAQSKFDRCEGDCADERRKLEEAKAKYARKAGE